MLTGSIFGFGVSQMFAHTGATDEDIQGNLDFQVRLGVKNISKNTIITNNSGRQQKMCIFTIHW